MYAHAATPSRNSGELRGFNAQLVNLAYSTHSFSVVVLAMPEGSKLRLFSTFQPTATCIYPNFCMQAVFLELHYIRHRSCKAEHGHVRQSRFLAVFVVVQAVLPVTLSHYGCSLMSRGRADLSCQIRFIYVRPRIGRLKGLNRQSLTLRRLHAVLRMTTKLH
ncbi:hypothetical protein IQ06DRAFT_34617 [Phaeosphaeriaceae sp. SRC1lsM3a]|nr:hypothetical protein IQ06DRAFT_34617 [Stagonospora sp. SRC1lsM3a]